MLDNTRADRAEVTAILNDLTAIAGSAGPHAATRAASAHLIAAAAFLEDRLGAEKTRKMLAAAIDAMGPRNQVN